MVWWTHFMQNGNNCTKGSVVWSVPGLTKSCTAGETTLLSDFRCFFNQTCLDILLSMFNVDMPNRLPLPPATQTMIALKSSNLSTFLPDDKLNILFNKLFVDIWELQPNFAGYYNICTPTECTYTINRKMDIIYVVTTTIGLIGGLAVIFRLLVPVTVGFIDSIVSQSKRSGSNIDHQQSENDSGKSTVGFV
jgi:hypothetical protein